MKNQAEEFAKAFTERGYTVIIKPPKPIRVQRSRKHKQVSPNGLPIIYVGRPTRWGNPFKVGSCFEGVQALTKQGAIALYETYAKMATTVNPYWIEGLEGKNLSCWCKIDEPCHADILLKLANGE